jgi:hypothetical protein
LAVPTLWVNNTTTPRSADIPPGDTKAEYDQLGDGVSPNNPGFTMISLDDQGHPLETTVLYGVGLAALETLDTPQLVRSYLSSVQFSPDGALIAGTMEGSKAVGIFSANPSQWETYDNGFSIAPGAFVGTDAGPRGLAFLGSDAWVYNFMDLTLGHFDMAAIATALATTPAAPSSTARFLADPGIVLDTSSLSPEVLAGRALYYSAVTPHFTYPPTGLSCATCHFEGRNDALNWPIRGNGNRQTLSHVGPVSSTPPFTWTGNMPTVPAECNETSQVRLGGEDVTDAELEDVAAFIDFIPDVDIAPYDAEAAARGQILFERQDVGCAGCHYGSRYTDNQSHDIYGTLGVNTPGLVGISATSPYLHEGTAPNLRDVLETSRQREMGDTSMLSEAEMLDLEEYLRSL